MIPPVQKTKREPIKTGTHLAVCTMIAELGTQETVWQGEVKHPYQVAISWDFPKQRIEIEKDGVKQSLPRRKSRTYTFSYHEKSSLGVLLKSWYGEQPKNDFNLLEMLGKPAMITVTHTEKEGTVYDNISAVTQLMDGIDPPKAENNLLKYSIREDGINIPDEIPDWAKDKIKLSTEWQILEKRGIGKKEEPKEEEVYTDYGPDDDIPF